MWKNRKKYQFWLSFRNLCIALSFLFSMNAFSAPPVADASKSTNLIEETPVHAAFDGSLTNCDEQPCLLHWDFGDGNTQVQTTEVLVYVVNHTYTELGTYNVTLTVTDNIGQTDTDTLTVEVLPTELLSTYVETCKEELEFDDDDIPNDLNCATGHLFDRGPNAINDFVDYRRVTDQVDLVFACRWLQNGIGPSETFEPPFHLAESVEMFIHNRENGNTCFFKAKDQDIPLPDGSTRHGVSVSVVSPTVAADALPGTREAEYWDNPIEIKRNLPCAQCHVAGPVIATPRIAPFLARFGLLNNGHDTFGRIIDDNGDNVGKYFAVGETLSFFNDVFAENNERADSCGNSACHSLALHSDINDVQRGFRGGVGEQLLPAIKNVIYGSDPDTGVIAAGVMPPLSSPDHSHYTWINRDTPYSSPNDSDIETFVEAKKDYEGILSYCDDPGYLVTHVVDSDVELKPDQFSDQLSVFNAQDGVICRKSEQSDGQCNNFRVRYQCTDSTGNISMTSWYNTDSPSGEGDFERRSDHANVCIGTEVTGIEASSTISTGWTAAVPGPVDRLAQFDRYGLVCHNNQQNDGQCDNYVVKFVGCSDAPEAYTARLRSTWSGRVLTASDTYNNALTKAQPSNSGWSSQDWIIEPVINTGHVRLKNLWSGTYLNSESDAEFADIVVYSFVEEWGSQQWIIEDVFGSSDVRFKNVWTGKYLTVNSTGDYADIKSQALNPSWPSQRWQIQE